jgi:GxxExxY protein
MGECNLTTECTEYTERDENMGLIYVEESYVIRGAIYEVYKTLGAGFLEAVYQEALEMELSARSVPFVSQKEIRIKYKGALLNQSYRADVVCYDKIILELKSVKQLLPEHEAQLLNYLKATNMKLGFLVNFSCLNGVDIRRIAS